jgi:hypothetical protein
MQGNLHVPFLGGLAGAIPPGYPAMRKQASKVLRLVLTQLESDIFRYTFTIEDLHLLYIASSPGTL